MAAAILLEMGGRARKTAGYVMFVMAIVAPVNAFTFQQRLRQTDKYRDSITILSFPRFQ